jgi:hypothetical protein
MLVQQTVLAVAKISAMRCVAYEIQLHQILGNAPLSPFYADDPIVIVARLRSQPDRSR